MSRDFMEDYLQHSWGKKPEQKAREKQYNADYYKKNRDKWKQTYKDTNKFYRDLRKKAVKQGHESMAKRRATLTAANEAAKARAIAEKQYGIFKQRYDIARVANSIEAGIKYLLSKSENEKKTPIFTNPFKK